MVSKSVYVVVVSGGSPEGTCGG